MGRVSGLAVDQNNHEEIVLLTESGVWRTTDLGKNWISSNVGLPPYPSASWSNLNANLLTTHPHEPKTLYAPFNGGLFESINFGATWKSIFNNAEVDGQIIDLSKYDRIAGAYISLDDTLYTATIAAGRKGGLFKRTKNQESWELIAGSDLPLSGMGNDAFPFAVNRHSPRHMFAGGPHPATDGGNDGFKESKDSGETWLKVDRLKNESITTIWQDPLAFNYWLISGKETYELQPRSGLSIAARSYSFHSDRGITGWRMRRDLPTHVYSFTLDLKLEVWAASLDGLYHRANPYQRWKKYAALGNRHTRNVTVRYEAENRHMYIGTEGEGLLYSFNDGPFINISDPINPKPPVYCFDRIPGSSNLYVGTDGSGVFVNKQGEDSWQKVTPPINNLEDFIVNEDESEIIIGNAYGLYRWDKVTNELSQIKGENVKGSGILVEWVSAANSSFYTITLAEEQKGKREYTFHQFEKDDEGKYQVVLSKDLAANFVYDLKVGGKDSESILIAGENLLNKPIGLIAWNSEKQAFEEIFSSIQPSITEVEIEPASPAGIVYVTESGDLFQANMGTGTPQEIETTVLHNNVRIEMKAARPVVDWGKEQKIYIYDEDAAYSTDLDRPFVISYFSLKTNEWVGLENDEALSGQPDVFEMEIVPWSSKKLFLATLDRGVLVRDLK